MIPSSSHWRRITERIDDTGMTALPVELRLAAWLCVQDVGIWLADSPWSMVDIWLT